MYQFLLSNTSPFKLAFFIIFPLIFSISLVIIPKYLTGELNRRKQISFHKRKLDFLITWFADPGYALIRPFLPDFVPL